MAENYLNGTNASIVFFVEGPHILENAFARAVLILLYSFIFLTCFFGNLIVILVVWFQWKSRSVSKFCLGNMAVANFSVSVFCILQNLSFYLLDTWISGLASETFVVMEKGPLVESSTMRMSDSTCLS